MSRACPRLPSPHVLLTYLLVIVSYIVLFVEPALHVPRSQWQVLIHRIVPGVTPYPCNITLMMAATDLDDAFTILINQTYGDKGPPWARRRVRGQQGVEGAVQRTSSQTSNIDAGPVNGTFVDLSSKSVRKVHGISLPRNEFGFQLTTSIANESSSLSNSTRQPYSSVWPYRPPTCDLPPYQFLRVLSLLGAHIDLDAAGSPQRPEFSASMVPYPPSPQRPDSHPKTLFDALDLDGDGVLSIFELRGNDPEAETWKLINALWRLEAARRAGIQRRNVGVGSYEWAVGQV